MEYLSFLQLLLKDPCGTLTLAAVVFAIGRCAVGNDERVRRLGAALGGIVFLATVWIGVAQGGEVGTLAVCSIAWAGMTVGTSWIILAISAGIARRLEERIRASRLKQEQDDRQARSLVEDRERREQEYKLAEMKAKQAAEAEQKKPVIKNPTKEELIAEAKRRYATTLAMLESAGLEETELTAAKAQAKQQYLRDLDAALR
jgi:hypothetical protein